MMKMKKMSALALAAVMSLTLCACGSSTSSASSTASASSATSSSASGSSASGTRTFTVGFDAEYPPYGYMDDKGNYTGFDLELAQEVCNRNGWELVKQPIDWDSKDMELNSGSIDCIWNGFTMTGRESEYCWSEAYVDNSIVFVVRSDSSIQSAADLAGKVVTTQADSSALAALTDDPGDGSNDENLALCKTFASLEQVADYNTAFMNLESGIVDCIAVDIGVAQYQISSRGDTFRMLEKPLSTEQYAIGFKLGNDALRDEVQKTLDEMVADGTFMEIANHYASYNIPEMVCLGK